MLPSLFPLSWNWKRNRSESEGDFVLGSFDGQALCGGGSNRNWKDSRLPRTARPTTQVQFIVQFIVKFTVHFLVHFVVDVVVCFGFRAGL